MRIRFGEFLFDAETRQLTRAGRAVHLAPKAFDLLAILITQRPRAVAKQMLYDRLWPQTFVQPVNLHNLISEIRTALGDRDRAIVQTRTRFGFAFAAAAEEERNQGVVSNTIFRLACGAQTYDLHAGRNVIGRDASCAVVLDSPAVSRHHAAIDIAGSMATLLDLGSRNGTWLARRRLDSPAELRDRSEIEIGRTLLRFRVLDRRATTASDDAH